MTVTPNYASSMQAGIHNAIALGAYTGILDNSRDAHFDGVKTFYLSSIAVSGLQPHKRSKGWNEGSVENTRTPYTLDFDRDVEFFVDAMDVDETNQDLATANITAEFLKRQVIPEIDAYRFSKIATEATNLGNEETKKITAENAYTEVRKMERKLRKYATGYTPVIYVSSDVMDGLESSKEFNRSINVQNLNGASSLDTRITSINGVQIIEVMAEERFYDKFDFTEGFQIVEGESRKISILGVVKEAIIAATKTEAIYLFPRGTHTEGDGDLYQHRLYQGAWVKHNFSDGVFVVYDETEGEA